MPATFRGHTRSHHSRSLPAGAPLRLLALGLAALTLAAPAPAPAKGIGGAPPPKRVQGFVTAVTYDTRIMRLDLGRTAVLWHALNTVISVEPESPIHLASGECFGELTAALGRGFEGGGPCAFTDRTGDLLVLDWRRSYDRPLGDWTVTGGTGKWKGATGGGTYSFVNLTRDRSGQAVVPASGEGFTDWNGTITLR